MSVTSSDIQKHLVALAEVSASLERQVAETLSRTDKSVALANFCSYISGELRTMSDFYPSNTACLAWATRNLFECNLTIRYVLLSDPNFSDWLGQALRDEKDFIDGVLSTSGESEDSDAKRALEERLRQLDSMAERYSLAFKKPFRVSEIANELGLISEYKGLYKLFSKYVHPSSLLINSWHKQVADKAWNDIFLVKAQMYAGDSIQRIMVACGFPSSAT